MHKEKYDEAKSEFRRMVAEYPNETELFDRANVLIQVCDKRLKAQAAKPRLKGGNDYYNVGVAQLNGGALDDALEHLEQALKLLPKAEHVLYALGALSALRGESKNALDYLSKSIDERNENRFLAANDDDFASIAEDPEFIRLVSSQGA